MSEERSVKRRAIVTGLAPYLNEPELLSALDHWEKNYAASPRPTLQKFVFEIATEGNLRTQRSSMLLSLVKAMNLSPAKLLPDPMVRQTPDGAPSSGSAAAFVALVTLLLSRVPASQRYSCRLDLLDSLGNHRLPPPLVKAMREWLDQGKPLVIDITAPLVLRALINRTYVILCERIGPVAADKLLATATNDCQEQHPDLARYLVELL